MSSSSLVASSHWLIRAVPLLFIPADPRCWLLGEVGTGLDLMSPIPCDELKQSGAITLKQEGGREENTDPYRSADNIGAKVRHWNRTDRRVMWRIINSHCKLWHKNQNTYRRCGGNFINQLFLIALHCYFKYYICS